MIVPNHKELVPPMQSINFEYIRRKRREVCNEVRRLHKSTFYNTFGRDYLDHGDHVSLESLVDQDRGISYGVVQRGQHDPNGVPVARISNIVTNDFNDSDYVCVTPDISGQYKRTVLTGGEILVSIRGTIGRAAIAPSSATGWNVTREVAVIPLLPDVSRRYIHQLLLTDEAQRFITGNVRGIAQKGINLKDLRQLPVPSPQSETVGKFSEYINDIDSLEGKNISSLNEADDLFNFLVQRAFKGEL